MIRALWIDDEYTAEDVFIAEGAEEGIAIVGFNNSEDGLGKLEEDIFYFDAVILDAYTFKQRGDTVPDLEGLWDAYKRIVKISAKREIPCFIYSGKTNITKDKEDAPYLNLPTFDKYEPTAKLFASIKEAVKIQPVTQLRSTYKTIFSLFSAEYLGSKAESYLLDCLLQMQDLSVGLNKENEEYLNRLRKTLEAIFKALHRKCLLPVQLVERNLIRMNDARKFMNGEYLEIAGDLVGLVEDAHFPKSINYSVTNLLHRTNFASHYNEPGFVLADAERNEAELREYNVSPYLLHSLTYQLMDVLYWFKQYLDRYPNEEENKKLLKVRKQTTPGELPPITGHLKSDGTYFYINNCTILPKVVESEGWTEGDEITLNYYKPSNKENGYKYFCPRFRK